MITKLDDILTVIQCSRASHQKHLKVLINYYKKVPLEEFVKEICASVKKILCSNMLKNDNILRTLDFLGQFIAAVTPVEEEESLSEEDVPHPFLTRILVETLKYHDVAYDFVRFNSCLFVRLILHHIGNNINLENDVCDLLEEAMLERTQDPKSSVRLQAVMALLRLQSPTDPDCPVIAAFLSLIVDSNAGVRAEVVKTIAPYLNTIPHIVKRLRDVDPLVRAVAFRRCADVGPRLFKIVERQRILECGLGEAHAKARHAFERGLLGKWLSAYDDDLVAFLKALKLDGNESDIADSQEISKRVVAVLLGTVPINNVLEALSLDNKLVPLENLSSETATLWNLTVAYLRQHDELEEQLNNVVPELTLFSNYIESLSEKAKEKQMEHWENLDYQETLNNLLEIVEGFDFADEVGRKTLYNLTVQLLKEENLQFRLKKKIMLIASEVCPKSHDFESTILHLISDIQKPLVEVPVPRAQPEIDINKDCRRAELRVKIIKAGVELESATERQDFLRAADKKTEMDGLRAQLDALDLAVETAATERTDAKTTCVCLDLLIALLELPRTTRLTPSLATVKDEFVTPLLKTRAAEVNARVLNCLALFCFLDEELVEQCVKILSIPIITYRKIANYNTNALTISVKAIADLYQLHGENIFIGVADITSSTNSSTRRARRRLYNDETDDASTEEAQKFHLESVTEVMLDMLDDEVSEIRETAAIAITRMVMNNFPVTSPLITRLVLKWYNPVTVNSSDNLQQLLGLLIVNYSSSVKGAKEVIVKSIVPILNSIANAPNTSPLADVDVDNLLRFLAATTNADDKEVANTHLSMAHAFCYEIMKKKNASIVQYLSKMFLQLEIPSENGASLKELVAQLEIILEQDNCALDRTSRRNLQRFLERTRAKIGNDENARLPNVLESIAEESDSGGDAKRRKTDGGAGREARPNGAVSDETRRSLGQKRLTNGEPGAAKKRPKMAEERKTRDRNGENDKNTTASHQDNNKSLNGVSRITRNSSRLSDRLDSSADTILHTILDDTSQTPPLSISASSDDGVGARKSARSSKAPRPSLFVQLSRCLDMVAKEKSGFSSGPSMQTRRRKKK